MPANHPPPGLRASHPISVVTRRTGLTQDLLRAWERRYQAVVPERTVTGRRLYTDADLERLLLLKRLVDGGRRIGDIARLAAPELRALAADDARAAGSGGGLPPHDVSGATQVASDHLAACEGAVGDLDRPRLEHVLADAAVQLGPSRLRREVLVPLVELLGSRWQAGEWRASHEHLASAVVRACLWDLLRQAEGGAEGGTVVVATPAGHRHELGALLAATVAAERGWSVVYLGADLPADEIAAVARRLAADTVLISLVFPADDPRTAQEILRLRSGIGSGVRLLVGGRAAASYEATLVAARAVVVGDLGQLGDLLQH